MPTKLTNAVLKKITPRKKPYEIRDSELKGFILRIQPSGIATYICQYARTKRITIGQANLVTLTQARDRAKQHLADAVLGGDPMAAKKAARAHTLESFVEERYRAYVEANQTSARETLRRVSAYFPEFGKKRLSEITAWMIEKHRSGRLKTGLSPKTVNRDLDSLRGAFSKAIEWGLLKAHPMAAVKNSRVDALERVRYLSADEEKRLRDALDKREAKRRQDRENFNAWRRERGYKEFQPYTGFTDHLKPIVLLTLNTGLRRGEVFNLKWPHVDFGNRILTVAGRTAKSKKTRYIPLNLEAFAVLRDWRNQARSETYASPARAATTG